MAIAKDLPLLSVIIRRVAPAAILVPFLAGAAIADLRLCNKTLSRVGVSIGYKTEKGWATEGWWNVEPEKCQTLQQGVLSSRFYYVYAVDYDNGGEWGGQSFMCTKDKEFTIDGVSDCSARGFQKTGFFEIDTGNQTSWTIQLTEAGDRKTEASEKR